MGKIRIEKYGSDILEFINEYADENNIEVKEIIVKENKPKKENTKLLTLKMFKEGMSISEIATNRDFVYTTIEGHLASFLETGEIDVFDLISKEKYTEIKKALKGLKLENLTNLRSKLNDKYSYSELRFTLNALKNDSK